MDENGKRPPSRAGRALPWAVQALAALVAGWWGFGFGNQVSGVLLGVVTALNAAAFGGLLAGAVLHRIASWRAGR